MYVTPQESKATSLKQEQQCCLLEKEQKCQALQATQYDEKIWVRNEIWKQWKDDYDLTQHVPKMMRRSEKAILKKLNCIQNSK